MVSSYDLVPEHKLLSESDAKKVSKKYNVGIDKFPKILDTDPQAARLKAQPGQLISITRNDGGTSYVYYRVVVKG